MSDRLTTTERLQLLSKLEKIEAENFEDGIPESPILIDGLVKQLIPLCGVRACARFGLDDRAFREAMTEWLDAHDNDTTVTPEMVEFFAAKVRAL